MQQFSAYYGSNPAAQGQAPAQYPVWGQGGPPPAQQQAAPGQTIPSALSLRGAGQPQGPSPQGPSPQVAPLPAFLSQPTAQSITGRPMGEEEEPQEQPQQQQKSNPLTGIGSFLVANKLSDFLGEGAGSLLENFGNLFGSTPTTPAAAPIQAVSPGVLDQLGGAIDAGNQSIYSGLDAIFGTNFAAPVIADIAGTGAGAVGTSGGLSFLGGAGPGAGLATSTAAPVGSTILADGSAGVLLADGSTVAASGGAATGAGTGALSTAGNALGAAASLYSAYQIGSKLLANEKDGLGGALGGATIGFYTYGPIGAVIGALIGLGLGQIGGSKDPDTLERRAIKTHLGKNTNLGESLEIALSGGGKGSLLHQDYNVDFAGTPYTGEIVALADPLAFALTYAAGAKNPNRQTDLAGEITNLALSGTTSKEGARGNLLRFAKGIGWHIDDFKRTLVEARKNGDLDAHRFQVFMQNLNSIAKKKGKK